MAVTKTPKIFRVFASLLLACFVFVGVGTLVSRTSAASAPNILNYQGRLLNTNGVPVSDGTASVSFALYTLASGGVCLWTNSSTTCASTTARTVTLTDGLFSENLGDTLDATPYAAIADAVFAENSTVYLAVTVNSEPLWPRKLIVAAPFALNSDTLDGFDGTQGGGTAPAVLILDAYGNLQLTGTPLGTGYSQGSLYINPAAGGVSSDEILLGIAVGGNDRFSIDEDGDTIIGGDLLVRGGSVTTLATSLNLFNTTATTLNFAGAATMLNIADAATTSRIDIGGIEGNGANTINVATNSTSADSIIIGNNNAATTIALVGGDDWSIAANGLMTTANDLAVNGGDITSTAALTIASTGGNILLSPNGSGLVHLLDGDNFGIGGTAIGAAAFYVLESENTVSIGDGANDGFDPTIILYASNNTDYAKISLDDTDTLLIDQVDVAMSGDLDITGSLSTDGSILFGDGVGDDHFTYETNVETADAVRWDFNKLSTGTGMSLIRYNDAVTDFQGSLLALRQSDTGVGSLGQVQLIENFSVGDTSGLVIFQDHPSDETNGAGGLTIGAQALVLESGDPGSSNDIMLVRSAGFITLAIQSDGSVLSDGGYSALGADYAEYFSSVDASLSDSEVVCHDRANANAVKRCEAGNTEVLGVVSPTPGFIGGLPQNDDLSTRVIVGLNGQIDTFVTAAEGAIAIGDAVTASQTVAGYAAKAFGPERIIGFALEPLASGTGMIKIYVNPQWYGGDVLSNDGTAMVTSTDIVSAPVGAATASISYDSHGIALRGSAWDGASVTKDMTLRTSTTDGDDAYRLSVVNDDGQEVAYVGESGDLALAGHLYPSDRGVLQTSKYIYYDGSAGAGGDVMRTNSGGWGTGSYDFAEMFPSRDALAAGEVVIFADNSEEVKRSTGTPYDDKIAGIISTRPGFLAGENLPGHVAVALTGRVPTYVSGENGAIAIGDPLTTSTKAGYAMKATEPGAIVGYAMEAFGGTTGVIIAVVRPSYYDGSATDTAPAADNSASGLLTVSDLDVSGVLNMNAGRILSIGSLSGIGGNWHLAENGDFVTRGRLTSLVRGYNGVEIPTVAALGNESTIQTSGTATLEHGSAYVVLDPSFTQVIATEVPYRVIVTPSGVTGQLYVADRTQQGFVIRDSGNTSDVLVDWFVIAYHKDFAPESVLPGEELPSPVIASPENDETTEELPAVDAPVTDESENAPESDEETVPTEPDASEVIDVDAPILEEADAPSVSNEDVVAPEDVILPPTDGSPETSS